MSCTAAQHQGDVVGLTFSHHLSQYIQLMVIPVQLIPTGTHSANHSSPDKADLILRQVEASQWLTAKTTLPVTGPRVKYNTNKVN